MRVPPAAKATAKALKSWEKQHAATILEAVVEELPLLKKFERELFPKPAPDGEILLQYRHDIHMTVERSRQIRAVTRS